MRIVSILFIAIAALPSISNAAPQFHVDDIFCAGPQTTNFGDIILPSCDRNFLFGGESISPLEKHANFSDGTFAVRDTFVSAPNFSFISDDPLKYRSIPFVHGNLILVDTKDRHSPSSIAAHGSISIRDGSLTPLVARGEVLRAIEGMNVQLTQGSIAILSPVPEPSAWLGMISGLLLLAGFFRFKKSRNA